MDDDGDLSSSADAILLSAEVNDDPEWYTVYLLDSDHDLRPIAPGSSPSGVPVFDVFPAWSPDGSLIAFVSTREGGMGIFTVQPDGEELQVIVDRLRLARDLEWSPSGDRLVYADDAANNEPDLFIVGLDEGQPRNLTNADGTDGAPRWSPAHDLITYVHLSPQVGLAEIMVIEANGANTRTVSEEASHDVAPAWSPDGAWIAYQNENGLLAVRPDGTERRQIVDDPDINNTIFGGPTVWSPDGGWLAFTSYRDGSAGVYRVRFSGEDLSQMTGDSSRSEIVVDWSRDGASILILSQPANLDPDSDEGTLWDLQVVEVESGEVLTLAEGLRLNQFVASPPAWRP